MTGIFDSHAHYDDPSFDQDRAALLEALPNEGVVGVVNCASDFLTSKHSIALAEQYPYFYAAVGVHPHECAKAGPFDAPRLKELLDHPKVVALGEIGLDYHYDFSPRFLQLEWFERQLSLAAECHVPVIIHDREAHADTLHLLQKYRPQGVVHCFSGSVEMAKQVIDLGMYIGLGGAVTFRNAKTPPAVAAFLPLDRLLLETDAPYMTPVPLRGQRNDSRRIALSAQRIADLRGIPVEEVLQAGLENAHRLFGIS